ncbi:MAG TPA: hypothetical protein VK590_13055 [Saprospiraceae bacterium]|nr:hypothetical protein [Saprospiraceae bacterium]
MLLLAHLLQENTKKEPINDENIEWPVTLITGHKEKWENQNDKK